MPRKLTDASAGFRFSQAVPFQWLTERDCWYFLPRTQKSLADVAAQIPSSARSFS
ncbi:hypothetical protein [Streptomyces mirabilis]|uniref:hypothetical protein n=1 Tax=Streptomyces mirabilis TaxID=68239 RepID=UPI00331DAF97